MMYRAFSTALNRTMPSCAPLVKPTIRKQIFRKSTTSFRKHVAIVSRYRKLDHTTGQREFCSEEELNINTIKNAFCKELSIQDIGEVVQLRGMVMHIKKGDYIILKDNTGSMRLVIDKNREDLIEWMEKLEKYSVLKILGVVTARAEGNDDDTGNREKFDVVVNYVISSLPPSKMENVDRISEQKERSELLESSTTSGNTVTCEELKKGKIRKSVQIFGWVNSIDNMKKAFILSDAHGSIKVVPYLFGDVYHEVQNLKVGDVIVVEGTLADSNMQPMKHAKFNKQKGGKLEFSAHFVKKLNEDNFLGLRAPDVNRYTMRTHNCGELNASHVGQRVRLMGWIAFVRMDKFVLLHDKYGMVQLTCTVPSVAASLKNLSLESVISVGGIVSLRPPGNENKMMKTGEIEINVTDLASINEAEVLPFYQKDARPARPTQLEYRYLDLRQHPTTRMNLEFRCQTVHKMRRFLIETLGFVEIETPTLFSRTPGGAQEFVVPTRKQGEFYALVQSPQQFKQVLMVGGLDRYFQIARCYRDEDSKKDRQPEFTQLDIEMSFCDRDGVMKLIEDVVRFTWPQNFHPITLPFPRITYEEAMTSYGTDKPDTRFEWKINDLTDVFKQAGGSCSEVLNMEKYTSLEDFTALSLVAEEGMVAFPVLKQLAEELAMSEDCKIFPFKLGTKDKLDGYLNKLFLPPTPEVVKSRIRYDAKDVVFLGFGQRKKLLPLYGKLRKVSAKIVEEHGVHVIDKNQPFNFLWVVDFPLFEEVDGVIQSVHHPFTQPHPDDAQLLETHPVKVRGLHYDLVLNGNEIGGGSIRIHDAALQEKVLTDILKLDKSYFKHLITALSYGAPVHGGFALGIDRFIALLRGTQSIVDVIAFPKYSSGRDPLSGAPTDIPQADKDLYHLK